MVQQEGAADTVKPAAVAFGPPGSAARRCHHKPVGNTEGWGIITWLDHPSLTWDIIKESAEICAGLGRKHGYGFNCTSDFTHPQFPRLWADIEWHKRVTSTIRGR